MNWCSTITSPRWNGFLPHDLKKHRVKNLTNGNKRVTKRRVPNAKNPRKSEDLEGFNVLIYGVFWLRGQDLNLRQAQTKLNVFVFAHPSPPEVRGTTTPNPRPTPSTQFDPDPAIIPSNPSPASTRGEPRSLNLEMLSTIRGSRSVDHGPICSDLGPGFRQGFDS